jgi:hypothetical protein
MPIKAWSYWYPDVLPHVPGCPNPMVDFQLRRAAQAFFKDTRAWQVTQPLVAVAALQSSVVVLPADSGQELVRIEQAWFDRAPIGPTTADTLDRQFVDDWTLHTGTPNKVYQLTPGTVRLYPLPVAASVTGLKLRLSVRPSDSATGLDDEMAVKFRDDIANGAKAKLMMMNKKSWTDMDMAGIYSAAFDAACGSTSISAARSFGSARKPSNPKWC